MRTLRACRSTQDRGPSGSAWRLGAYWLSRLGIVALITGIAFLVIYKFGEMGIALRVTAGYAVGAALTAMGRWVSRRHRVFGEVLVGGGLAVGYFVTYALHFVRAVRVVESDSVAMVLLAVAIVAVVAIAHRMRSETVAGIALFLGLHSGMLTDATARVRSSPARPGPPHRDVPAAGRPAPRGVVRVHAAAWRSRRAVVTPAETHKRRVANLVLQFRVATTHGASSTQGC